MRALRVARRRRSSAPVVDAVLSDNLQTGCASALLEVVRRRGSRDPRRDRRGSRGRRRRRCARRCGAATVAGRVVPVLARVGVSHRGVRAVARRGGGAAAVAARSRGTSLRRRREPLAALGFKVVVRRPRPAHVRARLQRRAREGHDRARVARGAKAARRAAGPAHGRSARGGRRGSRPARSARSSACRSPAARRSAARARRSCSRRSSRRSRWCAWRIEPKTSADRERLASRSARMVAADPSLRLESDAETGQTLLAGMGQLHLDIAVERLATEHGVRGRDRQAAAWRIASTLPRTVRARATAT